MKLLLRSALKNRKHLVLLFFTILAMLGLTVASQMEMLSLGVLTNTGVDAFSLFSQDKEGKSAVAEELTIKDIQQQWPRITGTENGTLTHHNAHQYMATRNDGNPLNTIVRWVNGKVPLWDNIWMVVILLIVIAIFKGITFFFNRYMTRLVAIRVSRDLRQQYFEHIQSLPMSFYQQYNSGALACRVGGDATMVATAINAALLYYVSMPFKIVSTLVLCFYLSWQLSLVLFLGLPLLALPIWFLAKRIKRITRQMQKRQEIFAQVLYDFLIGVQTIKLFAREPLALKKYKEQNDQIARLEERTSRYDLSSRPVIHAIATLFLATVIIMGLFILHMNLSALLVFCGLLTLFYEPVKQFAEVNSQIQQGIVAADRMYEVLNLQPTVTDAPNALTLETFKEKIEFDNVWFRYNDTWVLKGISFTIEKGQTVAFVGPTGAGKTTIAQLLPRLYDIQKGEIRIDGIPITQYTQKSLRENISSVPQRPFIFVDTAAENIAFGRPYSREEIENAAKQAHADEFLRRLPEGYDTTLSEMGKALSGGQQQRLVIARALLKNAPILIMDEATSSLDAVSENYIKKAIEALHGKITQLLIAHRLSTVANADKIIYIEHGIKVAEGPCHALLETCPEFRHMWELMYRHEQRQDQQAVATV